MSELGQAQGAFDAAKDADQLESGCSGTDELQQPENASCDENNEDNEEQDGNDSEGLLSTDDEWEQISTGERITESLSSGSIVLVLHEDENEALEDELGRDDDYDFVDEEETDDEPSSADELGLDPCETESEVKIHIERGCIQYGDHFVDAVQGDYEEPQMHNDSTRYESDLDISTSRNVMILIKRRGKYFHLIKPIHANFVVGFATIAVSVLGLVFISGKAISGLNLLKNISPVGYKTILDATKNLNEQDKNFIKHLEIGMVGYYGLKRLSEVNWKDQTQTLKGIYTNVQKTTSSGVSYLSDSENLSRLPSVIAIRSYNFIDKVGEHTINETTGNYKTVSKTVADVANTVGDTFKYNVSPQVNNFVHFIHANDAVNSIRELKEDASPSISNFFAEMLAELDTSKNEVQSLFGKLLVDANYKREIAQTFVGQKFDDISEVTCNVQKMVTEKLVEANITKETVGALLDERLKDVVVVTDKFGETIVEAGERIQDRVISFLEKFTNV